MSDWQKKFDQLRKRVEFYKSQERETVLGTREISNNTSTWGTLRRDLEVLQSIALQNIQIQQQLNQMNLKKEPKQFERYQSRYPDYKVNITNRANVTLPGTIKKERLIAKVPILASKSKSLYSVSIAILFAMFVSKRYRDKLKEMNSIKSSLENGQTEIVDYVLTGQYFSVLKERIKTIQTSQIDYLFKDGVFQRKPTKAQMKLFHDDLSGLVDAITHITFKTSGTEFKKAISILVLKEKYPANYLWPNELTIQKDVEKAGPLYILYYIVVKTFIQRVFLSIGNLDFMEDHYIRALVLVLYKCVRDCGNGTMETEPQFVRLIQYFTKSLDEANEWNDQTCKALFKACDTVMASITARLFEWAVEIEKDYKAQGAVQEELAVEEEAEEP